MVKLKATYDKKEDIPDLYADLFKEKGEKWCIEIDGITTEANVQRVEWALKQEREENAKLREDAKSHGKTPEEVQTLIEELEAAKAAVESGGGKPSDEQINKLVEAQLRTRIGPLERTIQKLTKERDDSVGLTKNLKGEITLGKIEAAIRQAAEKAKVLPSAIPDIVMRARPAFDVIEENGKTNILTKDGGGYTPGLVPEQFVEELAESAPHYWPPNVGAGANGSGVTIGISEPNPFTKKNWNMTEQGALLKKYGTEKTEQLAKAVGSAIGATKPPEQ